VANEESAILETVVGKVVVFDVCFLRGAKASHTLLVTTDDGIHVYVDIGHDSSLVALTLIHGLPTKIQYIKVPDDNAEPLYGRLSALAAQVFELDKKGTLQESRNTLVIPRTIHWRN